MGIWIITAFMWFFIVGSYYDTVFFVVGNGNNRGIMINMIMIVGSLWIHSLRRCGWPAWPPFFHTVVLPKKALGGSIVVDNVVGLKKQTVGWLYLIILMAGWWLTYPSEKYEFVKRNDEIPNIWENKTCSKPPTRNQRSFANSLLLRPNPKISKVCC